MSDLDRYQQKRHFDQTPEPSGSSAPIESAGQDQLRFVVQKHAARRLHYDVRIEVDGVMPSWAVPKGPSFDPTVKRLAVHVEDHPLDYQAFEGIIPKGQYGGGPVIVWDHGTYRNITERDGVAVDARTAIANGHISLWFEGEKLQGGWALTRTSGIEQGGNDPWIMVKRKDEFANPELDITESRPESVVSQRTIEEVVQSKHEAEWTSGTATWAPPMLAELSKTAPTDEGWMYERKIDGLRCLAVRNEDEVHLWSRNHLSFDKRFPRIIEALRELPVDNFVFDGEIAAVDKHNNSSFEVLQRSKDDHNAAFYIFDVLHLIGKSTTHFSLLQRKELIEKAVFESDELKVVEVLPGNPEALLQTACEGGWEGLIAKRIESRYVGGRSSDWKKLKCSASQELIIVGWTDPQGVRVGFGALLLGYYDEGQLHYAGKVGTGFNHQLLTDLYGELHQREIETSPFVEKVREKGAHWARPELVANIAFGEWTADGKLRHPRFEGLRPDKDASTVVREQRVR